MRTYLILGSNTHPSIQTWQAEFSLFTTQLQRRGLYSIGKKCSLQGDYFFSFWCPVEKLRVNCAAEFFQYQVILFAFLRLFFGATIFNFHFSKKVIALCLLKSQHFCANYSYKLREKVIMEKRGLLHFLTLPPGIEMDF